MCKVVERQNGGMAEWQNGGMVKGGMAEWWNGGMAEWRNGGMEEWRNGVWECLTTCKALSHANGKGTGTNDWVIKSLDD